MASTYSTNLKIELIGTGEQNGTWGGTTNNNFTNVFEQSIVGRVTVNFATDANKTLSTSDSVSSQDFRNVYLNLTSSGSLTATRDLIVPTINKNYIVQNNTTGSQSIRVITAAGTGITVPNGSTGILYVDGTNVIQAFDYLPTLTVPTLNVTTLDLTNIEVTNIKAKDGTASASIADSTGAFTVSAPFATIGNTTLGNASGDTVTVTGTITSNLIFTDNTYDIGASGATRPRNLYLAGDATIGGSVIATTLDLTNLEVTNIKAKDGTASASIADSTGIFTHSTATVISVTDNTNAALRITQLGTGNALLVEDSSNPDSTPFVIDNSGYVIVGNTTRLTTTGTGLIQSIVSTGANTFNSTRFSSTSGGSEINFSKSDSDTVGINTIVASGDTLGSLSWSGADGTNYVRAASIYAVVDGTPGTNDMPGRLVFSTTADGASSPTERMRIGSDGSIGVGIANTSTYTIRTGKNITGGTSAGNFYSSGTIQSDVTSNGYGFISEIKTAAASFVLGSAQGFRATQGTIGAGSSITNQYGFHADSTLTGATNNYGFYSNIASGTGRYNFYAAGTADNYLAGSLGIGGIPGTGQNLVIGKTFTGAVSTYGTLSNGQVQSDVTNTAQYFRTTASTAAASFTLSDLRHYDAQQGTFGAGSTVNIQYGFLAGSSLTGATNNYGFYGAISSGAGRYNIYMNGTADNYMAGKLGIGTTPFSDTTSLSVSGNMTGASSQNAVNIYGSIQSDVTSNARGYYSQLGTAAAAFTLSSLQHFAAVQLTFGAGSTVTSQYGFVANANLIGATNNYGFYGDIASGTNRWNLYMNGTAQNYLRGALWLGSTSPGVVNFAINSNITGGTVAYGSSMNSTIQSDVTSTAVGFNTSLSTQAAAFTLTDLNHFYVNQGTIGASSAVTNQYGFRVASSLTGATNNYGFYSNIASGSNRWNLYMNGTAGNYMAGTLWLGSNSPGPVNLSTTNQITGGTTAYSVAINSSVQSDVTASATGYSTYISTAAASFTLTSLLHHSATQGTIGAGSTVTNQYGYVATNSLIGATNNYGFFGNIASGTGRYNLYMNGTADNYMAGNLALGTAATSASNLRIASNITGGTSTQAIRLDGTIQSDATSYGRGVVTVLSTQATTFTLNSLIHLHLNQGTIGAGSTVTNQYGVFVASSLTGATNNYGLYSDIASGTNRWNIYMNGTASNYLAGPLYIGGNYYTTAGIGVNYNSGGTQSTAFLADATIQSATTSQYTTFSSYLSTQAASFTLPTLTHFSASQNTIGAGSTVTNQYGFSAASTLTGATNNYGFYGNITSGTGRWNLYMNGTAKNYIAGDTGIGVSPVASNGILQLGSYASIKALLETATITAAAPSATTNFDVITQAVQYYTTNASANFTFNVRGDSTTSLNTIMQTGQSCTIALLVTNGATPYYPNAFQVDGGAVTPKWQGGTAPTSGNANSVDVYSFTVIKTASATFTVLASQTKFA